MRHFAKGAGFSCSAGVARRSGPSDHAVKTLRRSRPPMPSSTTTVYFLQPHRRFQHRFNPEVSWGSNTPTGRRHHVCLPMGSTSLLHPRSYQEESLRAHAPWAARCLAEHRRLAQARADEALSRGSGRVIRGQWEDHTAGPPAPWQTWRSTGARFRDGFRVRRAREENLGTIVAWVCEELGETARHLLGISEPG